MEKTAVLIIAIAFAVLVLYAIVLLRKLSNAVDEAKTSLQVLTSDINVTLHQTNDILAKANILV